MQTTTTPEQANPRVLLVDDHDLFRTGLRNLLEEEGVDVVGEAAAGEEAVNAGINAGEIVSGAAKAVGGGGGGRQFFASGGGPLKEKAEEAMRIIEETIQRQLSTLTAKEVA